MRQKEHNILGDIVELYKNYINGKVLSKEELYRLIEDYQRTHNPLVKEKIIQGNMKLVISMTKRFYNKSDYEEDLCQVGIIGLIKAIEHFDTQYQLQFSTYAVPLIVGEMKRYLRDNSPIRITRTIKDLAYAVLKTKENYLLTQQREPTLEELCKELKVSSQHIIEAIQSSYSLASFQEMVSQEDDLSLLDVYSIDEHIQDDYHHHLDLQVALNHLNKRERKIVDERYFQGLSQCEIAKELMISQAQVSRIEKKALEKLHNQLK